MLVSNKHKGIIIDKHNIQTMVSLPLLWFHYLFQHSMQQPPIDHHLIRRFTQILQLNDFYLSFLGLKDQISQRKNTHKLILKNISHNNKKSIRALLWHCFLQEKTMKFLIHNTLHARLNVIYHSNLIDHKQEQ